MLCRTSGEDESTLITLDERPVRQHDLDAAFGGPQVFLSIFNHNYLTEIMGGKAKGVLEEFLPHVEHADILSKMSPDAAGLLKDQSIPSPEIFQKNMRKRIRELEEADLRLDGKIEALEADKLALFTFNQEKIDRIDQLKALLADAETAALAAYPTQLHERECKLEALRWAEEHGALTEQELQELNGLTLRAQQLEAALSQGDETTSAADLCRQQKQDIAAKIGQLEGIMAAAVTYATHRTHLMFEGLALNKVSVQLFETQKGTGELKDVFRFTFEGRDYRKLSLSERVCAGLEVSEMMKALTGRNYPTIVDNYESIEEISNVRPTGQYFFLKVQPKAPLSVLVHKPLRASQLLKAG